jgi:nucleoside-diphosphate-sugar epimerase
MSERIFITGGTGFIGGHLARKFVNEGHEVCLFDIQPSVKAIRDIVDKVKIVKGDVSILPELLTAAREFEPTWLLHLSTVLIDVCLQRPMLAYRTNFDGIINSYETSRLLDVKKVFFASSEGVFAEDAKEPVDDDAPKYPRDPYATSKLFGENWGWFYVNAHGMDIRGVRPTWVWGPGRVRGSSLFTSLMVSNSYFGRESEAPELMGNWIYIEDLCDAVKVVLNAKEAPSRFYLVTGENHTTVEFAAMVKKRFPAAKIVIKKVDPNSFYAKWPGRKHGTFITKELDWKARFTTEAGIDDFIEKLRATPDMYDTLIRESGALP